MVVVAVSFMFLFVYLIPTTHELRIKGIVCTPDALKIKQFSDRCPFLGQADLAIANYRSELVWTRYSIVLMETLAVLLLIGTTVAIFSLAAHIGMRVLKRRRRERIILERFGSRGAPNISKDIGTIFISYRRADAAVECALLANAIRDVSAFEVFVDVDNLATGSDFVDELEVELKRSEAVLILIGRNWLGEGLHKSGRRIDDPHDYVRAEVRLALDIDIPIAPVLVNRARMPTANQLPEDIRALSRRNYYTLQIDNVRSDATVLLEGLFRRPRGL